MKLQSREREAGTGWMVAAKKGTANKIGYLAAHSAIVLVCIGGLLDGDLIVRAQMWFNGKTPFTGGGLIADVPAQHRLSPSNPTFRGNLLVTEGTTAGTAIIAQPNGVLLQDLPFSVELKKFIVEYYDTGMPKLFASDIVIHDHETGEQKPARVEVNHPASHRGINIYQSSFDDGGSKVTLQALPLNGSTKPFEVSGVIGSSAPLSNGDRSKLTLEFTGLRVINVENFCGQQRLGHRCAQGRSAHARSRAASAPATRPVTEKSAAQRRPQHQLQAARCGWPGRRVQQLHAAGGD